MSGQPVEWQVLQPDNFVFNLLQRRYATLFVWKATDKRGRSFLYRVQIQTETQLLRHSCFVPSRETWLWSQAVDNRVQIWIFGYKSKEETGGWNYVNVQLYDLYSSRRNIRVIKAEVTMGGCRNTQNEQKGEKRGKCFIRKDLKEINDRHRRG